MTEKNEIILKIDDFQKIQMLFGKFDENIREIEKFVDVNIIARDEKISISGEARETEKAKQIIDQLLTKISNQEKIDVATIRYTINAIEEGSGEELAQISKDVICVSNRGKPIKCKTLGQKKYIDTIKKNEIVFAIGPAGTGKTYLAMAMAVRSFKNQEVSRIILTRPAVEAGEKLGFLPGDLQDKVDPYLRPLYDALYDLMGAETYLKLVEKGSIEVAPLAYMRGRTLDNAFIILDEAQNTTSEQMKMFLTRMGMGSKVIITGDITQIDLPDQRKSGLVEASKVLNDVEGIGFANLSRRDVVRHPLVMSVIKAYEKYQKRQNYKENRIK